MNSLSIFGTSSDAGKSTLFGVDVSTINLNWRNAHLKNIYKSNELAEKVTIGKFPIVQIEEKKELKRELNFYNLT